MFFYFIRKVILRMSYDFAYWLWLRFHANIHFTCWGAVFFLIVDMSLKYVCTCTSVKPGLIRMFFFGKLLIVYLYKDMSPAGIQQLFFFSWWMFTCCFHWLLRCFVVLMPIMGLWKVEFFLKEHTTSTQIYTGTADSCLQLLVFHWNAIFL